MRAGAARPTGTTGTAFAFVPVIMATTSPTFVIDRYTGALRPVSSAPTMPAIHWSGSARGGDGASLLVVSPELARGPVLVEATDRGGVVVRVREHAARFECHADVIAQLLEAKAADVLDNAGAADGVFHWNLDSNVMVFSAPACQLLELAETAGAVSASELMDCLEADDQSVLVLAALGAITSRRCADVRVAVRGGMDSSRLRIVARRAEGGRNVLEGVIQRAGRAG